MISLDCFACKSRIQAPDEAAGRSGKCPKCGTLLLFPNPTVTLPGVPPQVSRSEVKLQKPKKKKFAKKESSSHLPVYMACGALGLLIILAVAAWSGVSIYLENRRSQQIREQELAELERKRVKEEKQNSFLEGQQKLDRDNLRFKQEKQKKDQKDWEDFNRQNEEFKRKKELATQEAAKDLKERNDQQQKEQQKEAQEKEKRLEQEKRREAERKRLLEMIEQDHKTILAYKRIHIRNIGAIRDILWSPPLRALMVKGKEDEDDFRPKEGLLYRLQGVVGENRIPVSYYFFLVNREVVVWESAKSNKAISKCKIIGELEIPD
jgi:hypothetical protein